MENKKTQEFTDFVCNTMDELKKLFLTKNTQYCTADDPLANFSAGARLRTGEEETWAEMYEEAKNYRRKHIVHIERHGIDADKAVESLMDTAIYSVIMMFMYERFNNGPEKFFRKNAKERDAESGGAQ